MGEQILADDVANLLDIKPKGFTNDEMQKILHYITQWNSSGVVRPDGTHGDLFALDGEIRTLPKHLQDVIDQYTVQSPVTLGGAAEEHNIPYSQVEPRINKRGMM